MKPVASAAIAAWSVSAIANPSSRSLPSGTRQPDDTVNRHTLQRQLGKALSRATRQHRLGALLLFDLDHFKEVNDAHGHVIGDPALRMVASRLRPALRESDTFARFGGDEFAVVAPDIAGPAGRRNLRNGRSNSWPSHSASATAKSRSGSASVWRSFRKT